MWNSLAWLVVFWYLRLHLIWAGVIQKQRRWRWHDSVGSGWQWNADTTGCTQMNLEVEWLEIKRREFPASASNFPKNELPSDYGSQNFLNGDEERMSPLWSFINLKRPCSADEYEHPRHRFSMLNWTCAALTLGAEEPSPVTSMHHHNQAYMNNTTV